MDGAAPTGLACSRAPGTAALRTGSGVETAEGALGKGEKGASHVDVTMGHPQKGAEGDTRSPSDARVTGCGTIFIGARFHPFHTATHNAWTRLRRLT